MKKTIYILLLIAWVWWVVTFFMENAEEQRIAEENAIRRNKTQKILSDLKLKQKKQGDSILEQWQKKQPRYIKEGFELIHDVLITNYAWNEPNELKWKGKTSLGKSAKNDTGCAINTLDFGYGDEFYFPHIKDYRVGDDTFIKKTSPKSVRRQKELLKYWSKKTGKNVKTHIDIRWKDKSDLKHVKTGVYNIYVKKEDSK